MLAMVFPLLIGIITGIASEQELEAGSFQMLLCTPSKKYIPHLGKLAVLLLFGIVFRAMGNVFLPISLYLKAAILLFLGNVPLYMLQYILSFAFGKGIGMGFGIIGSLLSALLLVLKLWSEKWAGRKNETN
ncbi:lantibiotic protection ABC transporter MutG family permease subunit [Marinisporobacter balticus]|uniref:Lantibiotic protection ABC transporter MutG family permease subunit n=2 Tax=Marinisporobacter balticus TaxID=2018667 RepID=A0A4R2K9M9_9FIRM|nr:lantibiotic protection ABC transporter MutG family permease subunit [Marinisporobacter balticus]